MHYDLENLLDERGYYLVPNVLSTSECQHILEIMSLHNKSEPIRDPLHKFNELWQTLLRTQLSNYFCFGPVIRSTLFTKPAQHNWQVPWHQDLVIQVQQKIDDHSFTAWSLKEGIHHCQAPAPILNNRRAFRIHLTQCHKTTGHYVYCPLHIKIS